MHVATGDNRTLIRRISAVAGVISTLRPHDLRAARKLFKATRGNDGAFTAAARFVSRSAQDIFRDIPNGMRDVVVAEPVSRTSYWLSEPNPLADYPWRDRPDTELPREIDTLVIGAGFTGASLAYHWARSAPDDRKMIVLDMQDPACGASGRSAGTVVMGRHYALVHDTVERHLAVSRRDLSAARRDALAGRFADVYVKAAHRNADLMEQTIRREQIACEYQREGWVQFYDTDRAGLERSVRMSSDANFQEWTLLEPEQAQQAVRMSLAAATGYSRGAATFHPARWVWSLLQLAIQEANVELFTRTAVQSIHDAGEHYLVQTSRGAIVARHLVNATEGYTPCLHRALRRVLRPIQTQAAYGIGGPTVLRQGVTVSSKTAFFKRHGEGILFGSDESPLPLQHVNRSKPSRFISNYVLGELRRRFGPFGLRMTNEWSGPVGFSLDEYPTVGMLDGRRQYLVAGMCGSGTGVSFNAGRCVVNQILELNDGPADYPPEFFSPTRLITPERHPWPQV